MVKFYDGRGIARIGDDPSWIANARMIIHDIETDPLGLEAELIAIAVQTAENFKITKFWTEPEKFWTSRRNCHEARCDAQRIYILEVNPQRQPPLPAGLAFSLTDPATGKPVKYDDCRELTAR